MSRKSPKRPRARRGVPDPTRHTRLGPKEERALLLLAWAGFLTTAQLRRAVGYPTLRRAQRRLRVLLDHGFARVELQSGALHRPSIHRLTEHGRERLVDEGRLDPGYRVPRLPRAQKRAHALLVRDVFVAFAAADRDGQLRLVDFRFDSDLTREEPFRSARLIPDAIARVETDAGSVTCAVECDAGTETTATLRKKFAAWRGVFDVWKPTGAQLWVVAVTDGRRRTLERLLGEARLDGVARAMLVGRVPERVVALTVPHNPAVRAGRSERRTGRVEVVGTNEISVSPTAAFRVSVT